jgi:hypothetical protein
MVPPILRVGLPPQLILCGSTLTGTPIDVLYNLLGTSQSNQDWPSHHSFLFWCTSLSVFHVWKCLPHLWLLLHFLYITAFGHLIMYVCVPSIIC